MVISPLKPTTRGGSYDTTSIAPPPASPSTTRTIRRLQSHQQLSSNSPSLIAQQRQQQLHGLAARESREQLLHPKSTPSLNPGRVRANSDAPMPFKKSAPTRHPPSSASHSTQTHTHSHSHSHSHSRKSSLEVLLREGPENKEAPDKLKELRNLILCSRVEAGKDGMSDYRCYLWLALLNIPALSTDTYLHLVHRGRSPAYQKISDDTFRTLATDTLFKRRVTDASITRVLNATAWKLQDAKPKKPITVSTPPMSPSLSADSLGEPSTQNDAALYVQGMNVLCAPFLYAARSETEAFALFHTFIIRECPGYIRGAMEGVHRGLALVDRCLAILNPTLSSYLLSKGMPAEIYAFPSVMTFCACTPPLPEVLHLWDFLFAYGPHLNIACIVAQLLLLKDEILGNASPMKVLRPFPQLVAQQIIEVALVVVKGLPEEVYQELVGHAK